MHFNDIDAFLAIVYCKSFSKAAENLYLTQSTVSRRLRNLEEELGTPLLERRKGSRVIELTPFGENFINVAERWRTLLKDTYQSPHLNLISLTIGASESLNNSVLSELYMALYRYDPPISLKVRTQQSIDLYRLIDRKECDVAFVVRESIIRNVIVEPIFSEPIIVLRRVHPDILLEPFITPSELEPEHEIFIKWSPDFQVWHDRIWDPFARRLIDIETTSLIPKLLSDPRQWVLAPLSIAKPLINSGNFALQKLSDQLPTRTVFMLTHRDQSPATAKAVSIIRECAIAYLKPSLQEFGVTVYL